MPDPLAPCDNDAVTIGDLGRMLCYLWQGLYDLHTDVDVRLQELQDQLPGVVTVTNDTLADVDGLRDWFGDPAGGPTLLTRIGTLQTGVDEVNSDADELIYTVGNRVGSQQTIVDAVYRESSSEAVADLAFQARNNTQLTGTPIVALLGQIAQAVFGGGSDALTVAQIVSQIWDAPPVGMLTEGPSTALTSTNSIDVPSGVYGYHLSFSVPGYWGKVSPDPIVYQPKIGVAAWRGAFGTVGEVVYLATPDSQVYQIPAGATTLDLYLEPGITGTYRELRWLGL
jgi:hypothetical protein